MASLKKQVTGLGSKSFGVFRRYVNGKLDDLAIQRFHRIFYDSPHTWKTTKWLGYRAAKNPLDCWIYQEMLYAEKPDLIIECGTAFGGSALFMATVCDQFAKGQIVSVDIWPNPDLPRHPRITYLNGSSTDETIVDKVREFVKGKEKVMVILDSDHTEKHVARELDIYNQFVTVGSYLIVEDSNINDHPVLPKFGPGPMEALQDFLTTHKNFKIDTSKERLYFTFNPDGFLYKMS